MEHEVGSKAGPVWDAGVWESNFPFIASKFISPANLLARRQSDHWHADCYILYLNGAEPINSAAYIPAITISRRTIMASTIKEKIQNAGQTAKDAAQKTGEKIKEGAEVVADKTADAAKATGEAVKNAGKKLKEKSGK